MNDSRLHEANQKILLHHCGFSLVRKQSSLEGAGKGVFILEGKERGHGKCTLYTVQPMKKKYNFWFN
jgi:hypothetical protein